MTHAGLDAFENVDLPALSGVSGGRTSALMHVLLPSTVHACFENTGREHPKTYDFLARVEDATQKPITWLEYVPPPRLGMAPKHSSFKIVSYETADRKGRPFEALLEALAAYRKEVKGKGPIVPWLRQRLCTAYMKIRVQRQYAASINAKEHTSFVGLRADEPSRVAQMKTRDTSFLEHRAPLSEAGIEKKHVLAFWAAQDFDLEIDEYQGNCTGCFLKDESDLTTALMEEETDREWWFRMNDTFGNMRPNTARDYRALYAEAEDRMQIREAVEKAGVCDPVMIVATTKVQTMTPRRHKLVVIQEQKRVQAREGFSCGCEGAERIANDDADDAVLAD